MKACTMTHEQFIQAIRSLAVGYARAWTAKRGGQPLTGEQLARIENAKLTYGAGNLGIRGITFHGIWKGTETSELIEICALTQESWVQLAGTTIHELAHAANPHSFGHNKGWKDTCHALGLRRAKEAGMIYRKANFAPELRFEIEALPTPDDGMPEVPLTGSMANAFKRRGCKAGQGSRGGKARGAGSGSRQRKYVCEKCGQIIRAGSDDLKAMHYVDDEVMGPNTECGWFKLDTAANKQGKKAAHASMQAMLAKVFGEIDSTLAVLDDRIADADALDRWEYEGGRCEATC